MQITLANAVKYVPELFDRNCDLTTLAIEQSPDIMYAVW